MEKETTDESMNLIKAFGYSISFILIIFVTYVFSMGNDNDKVIPYLLACFVFAFASFNIIIRTVVIPIITKEGSNSRIQIETTFEDINCLIMSWMLWIVYGIIFSDIYNAYGTLWILLQTLIIFAMVVLSYVPQIINNKIHLWTLAFCYASIVFFFYSRDGISQRLSTFVLVTKVSLFSILYIINDYKLQLPEDVLKRIGDGIYTKLKIGAGGPDPENDEETDELDSSKIQEQILRMRAVSLIRSYWVLACSRRLIIFSLFQIFSIMAVNYCRYSGMAKQKKEVVEQKKQKSQRKVIESEPEPVESTSPKEQKSKKKKSVKKQIKDENMEEVRIPVEIIKEYRDSQKSDD